MKHHNIQVMNNTTGNNSETTSTGGDTVKQHIKNTNHLNELILIKFMKVIFKIFLWKDIVLITIIIYVKNNNKNNC